MKKLSIILLLAVLSFMSNAQSPLNLGLKAGINTSKLSTNNNDYTTKSINHYLFGAFARINLGPVYLQPEAYYNSKGGKYMDRNNLSPTNVNSYNMNSVDVPVLIGLKIIDQQPFNLRIMAGPVFSFLTHKSVKGQGLFTENNIKNSFFAWQAGAGIDFLFLTLDARFEKYATDMMTAPEFNTKNGNFVVSLGIKFL